MALRKPSNRFCLGGLTGGLVTVLGGQVCAIPPALMEGVPADIVAGYFMSGPDPSGGPQPGPDRNNAWPTGSIRSTVHLASFLADRAHHMGLLSKLDARTRIWIDALALGLVVLEHPHAVVLFDIRGRERNDGGHELAGLHAALIIYTQGANEMIKQRIQHILNLYTNSNESVLSRRSGGENVSFTVRDRRLPPWASVTWGVCKDYYVLAVGEGVYDRIAATIADAGRSLGREKWFTRAATPHTPIAKGGFGRSRGYPHGRVPLPGGGTGILPVNPRAGSPCHTAWYVRFDKLRRNVARIDPVDALLDAKIKRVLSALGLAGVERGLWMLGRQNRSIEVVQAIRHVPDVLNRDGPARAGGQDEVRFIAGDYLQDKLTESVVPDRAGGYCLIDCNPQAVWRGALEAYLAAKSPTARQRIERFRQTLEASAGLSIEKDILSHLTGPVVAHNYPPHAFKLPLAWTILVPIDGDPSLLRTHLDRLLEVVRQRLLQKEMVQLRRDSDGVWYIQYGLTGPALTVTDRWLIVSFSPHALRRNLALLN